MRKLKLITHCTILTTTPALFAYPEHSPSQALPQTVSWWGDWWWGGQENLEEWVRPNTYDEIVQMLEDLESGELEKKYSPMQLEKVNDYLAILAKEGILPDEFEEECVLEEDTYDLMYGEDSAIELTRYLENSQEHMFIPAVFNGYSGYNIVQCGKISKSWKKTKKYVKKHKKAIIIGAVVVVAVAAVTVAVVATGAASAASSVAGVAAGAAASSSTPKSSSSSKSGSSESVSTSPSISQTQPYSDDTPIFKSAMEEEISSFKENLAQENFFQPTATGEGVSLEETGRAVGPLFAHDSFNYFNDQLSNSPQFSEEIKHIAAQHTFSLPPGAANHPVDFGHNEIDRRFASNSGSIFSDPTSEVNLNALSYQLRGEAARYHGYHGQAVDDFTKAINMNPTDPGPYLQRSATYFDMGQYEKSIEDFINYSAQVENSAENNALENIDISASDLAFAFARGMAKGTYIAVKNMTAFVGGLVTHPIQTSTQFVQSIITLVDLAKNKEWGLIADCLVPEARQLVNDWEGLLWDERAEISGTIFTQYGGEIFIAGGAAKATAKLAKFGLKGAQKVNRAAKGVKMAKETLILETAAEIGNGAKVGEIVNAGRNTLFLGEELGFTAKEMGRLKQAGKLEATLSDTYGHLNMSMKESMSLFKEAQIALKPYAKKPLSELRVRELIHETGIPTFPRPKGIPENYAVMIADKGAGIKYVHPKDSGTYVRIMPGKPHSPFPYQQKPYVNQRVHGKSVDKHGNIVLNDSLEAHIPIEEFIYKDVK